MHVAVHGNLSPCNSLTSAKKSLTNTHCQCPRSATAMSHGGQKARHLPPRWNGKNGTHEACTVSTSTPTPTTSWATAHDQGHSRQGQAVCPSVPRESLPKSAGAVNPHHAAKVLTPRCPPSTTLAIHISTTLSSCSVDHATASSPCIVDPHVQWTQRRTQRSRAGLPIHACGSAARGTASEHTNKS